MLAAMPNVVLRCAENELSLGTRQNPDVAIARRRRA